ncbi:MAG: NAD(P)/FAD-dependent oxidoreductase [Chthoniobacteraceae bacterium]
MNYDVVIIGGSLSGAASATLLLREMPDLKVLIIERAPQFGRRVGEATVEISGYFLGRVLGLTQHLNDQHLVKQGMRFWFANERTGSLGDASEIGPKYNVRLPSWQLDRAVVDEEVLRRAVAAGAELRRPAQVTGVQLSPGGQQVVTIRDGATIEEISSRWVIDASGFAALLARQEGWLESNTDHPTASAWARWRGVKDWDDRELAAKHPDWANRCFATRNTATNHIIGDGWWSWWIPLKGGDVSVGVVFDQRLVQFPQGEAKLGDRLKEFLCRHPVGREMLADAEWIEGDTHWRKNLAYSSRTMAGDGFALVGDAAAFLDPLYSPGMDWISFTATATTALIAAERRGEAIAPLIEKHNADFTRSYRRWFEAIYQDKYDYLGEFDLMRIAFRMDLGLYYLGIVSQPFKFGPQALAIPPFSPSVSTPVFHFIRTYNRRMAAIARDRRRRRALGAANDAKNYLFPSFSLGAADVKFVAWAALRWLGLELREGWRTWFGSPRVPTPVAPAAQVIGAPSEVAS